MKKPTGATNMEVAVHKSGSISIGWLKIDSSGVCYWSEIEQKWAEGVNNTIYEECNVSIVPISSS